MRPIIFISLVAVTIAISPNCKNQYYTDCGTACPVTCENYGKSPGACPAVCTRGYFCIEGYVRASDGSCVKPEQCPENSHPQNQHYEDCGTACPATCENYTKRASACATVCTRGYFCDEGYVRASDRSCVKPEQCRQNNCGLNEHFESCGNACPLTCDNYRNPPQVCVDSCISGCHCDDGYVKAPEGRCVRPIQCPISTEDVCELAKETGPCLAYFERYYFDKESQQCKKFVYGGCRSNGNNFKTIEECENKCKGKTVRAAPSACIEEKVVGPCKAAFKRYYHNKETKKCEEFTYGGCNANSNNFMTQEDCEAVCLSTTE